MLQGDVITVKIIDRLPGNRYLGDHNGKAVIVAGDCKVGEEANVIIDSIGRRLIYAHR